mmetsp:Transcript_26704/g.52625  ORF Transcript_26704/g.52625 Transcript_26704/m.52625 type:complete len:481 (-) Transcript_26704:144-1586(-)
MLSIVALVVLIVVIEGLRVNQVHLAYGDADDDLMVVSWATPEALSAPAMVRYGLASGGVLTEKATGSSERFKQLLNSSSKLHIFCAHCVDEYFHRVDIGGLKSGELYKYQIDGEAGVRTFRAKNVSNLWAPTLAVFGDMGTQVGPNKTIAPSIKRLAAEASAGTIDAVLHVGDFAYDFWEEGGAKGDVFMNQIEPIASRVPYMTCLGNHEGGTNFVGSLHHYVKRFQAMPGDSSGVYFSFDIGPAHIVSFSSEAYFWQLWEVEKQYAWLQKDLAAVNRSKTPWLITMAHRPMYCSNLDGDDCTKDDSNMRKGLPVLGTRFFALETLFNEHGVDLALWAHEHSYERTWPVFDGKVMNGTDGAYVNPPATTHIVTGAAGCREGIDKYKGPRGPWSAKRISSFGYGRLRLENQTHIHWEQVEDVDEAIVDEFWLIKDDTSNKGRRLIEEPDDIRASPEHQRAVFERTKKCTSKLTRLPECGDY